jgi:hypothetical protein
VDEQPAQHPAEHPAARLAAVADRLDDLAEVAELMDDDAGATRFRAAGARCRARAMAMLDSPRVDMGY